MPIAEITTLFLCVLAIALVWHSAVVAGLWRMFSKAGRRGWAAVIPLYRDIVRNEIAGVSVRWTYAQWVVYVIIVVGMYATDMVFEVLLLGWILLCVCNYFTYGPLLKAYGRNSGPLHVLAAVLFPYIVFPQIGFRTCDTALPPDAESNPPTA